MATEYANLIFRADTSEIQDASGALNRLERSGASAQATTQRVAKTARTAGGRLGGMGRNAGQAGIQIQQMVGQLQGGQSPMIALSQQGADLGFVLGVPLLGAVVGIGSALAGMVFELLNSSEAVSELKDNIDELDASLKSAAPRAYANQVEEQKQAVEAAKDAIRDQREEVERLEAELQKGEDALGQFGSQAALTQSPFMSATDATEGLAEKTEEARDDLEAMNVQLQTEERRLGLLTGTVNEHQDSIDGVIDKLEKQRDLLGANAVETLKYELAAKGATEAEIERAVAIQRTINAEQERIAAEEQARKDAEAAERQRQQDYEAEQKERLQAEEAAWQEMLQRKAEAEEAANAQRLERQAQQEQAVRDLEREGLLNRETDEYDSYQNRLELLKQHQQDKLITEQQYNEAKRNLDDQARQASMESLRTGLTALGQYNEEAFKIAKGLNIANAIMNTYTGATKALATYPPPFNFIAAAGVVATGLAQVAQIRSQTYQGRALGGQVRSGESYVVGERGPEVLTMGSSGSITPNESLRGGQSGGASNNTTNVTFQISTVDARGFDQLLQSRRGQIISMINSASNDRGRRAVV